MRKIHFLRLLLVLAIILLPIEAQTQVTIGCGVPPIEGSLLQLKDDGSYEDGETALKGLSLPRVKLISKYDLYPMFSNNQDYADNANDKKTIEDAAHVGLMVFNVGGKDECENFPGIYVWTGSEWEQMSGNKKRDPFVRGSYRADIEALKKIRENNPGKLDWDDDVDPIKWKGVVFESFCKEKRVVELNLSDKGLISAEGINELYSLKNLSCSRNNLTHLDITECTELQELRCSNNKLKGLNVDNNKKLKLLYVSYNELVKLDVGSCTQLDDLWLSRNVGIELVGLENCLLLTQLWVTSCAMNQLDVSFLLDLQILNCAYNNLSTLDVSALSNLTAINAPGNQLSLLDVSGNPSLTSLTCHSNKLSTLDLSMNESLTSLYCYSNLLSDLDISHCPLLKVLKCNKNRLPQSTLDNFVNHPNFCDYIAKDNSSILPQYLSNSLIINTYLVDPITLCP